VARFVLLPPAIDVASGAALRKAERMTKPRPYMIVVGVDQSETGDQALEQALRIGAQSAPAEVHAISVLTLFSTANAGVEYALATSLPGIPLEKALGDLMDHVNKKLALLHREFGSDPTRHLPRVLCHVRLDSPAKEIAQLAADLEADLVVVGSHGRRGLSRSLMGSVAEATVRFAPCPVLVTRPKRVVPTISIEPPCPECVKARAASGGERFWCDQHSEKHGQRHTYYSTDRVSRDGSLPLLFHA
jgi:nucleotide-binding universal stress UspA family protein